MPYKLLVCLALLLSLACSNAGNEPADHVFLGEHIVTVDEESGDVTAVAVRDETIVWVGSSADAEAWIGEGTQVHELGEKALLPGFIDAHGHLSFMAQTIDLANVASPPVGPAEDIAGLQQALREFIDSRGPNDAGWVLGMGYDDSLLAEQRHPDRHDLDAVSTAHPIALLHVSGHLMAANTLALERTGIDASTQDPPGGHFRREADGFPNGVLEETAMYPLRAATARPITAEQVRRALELWAESGLTTVQDGGVVRGQLDQLVALSQDVELPLDVHAYLRVAAADEALPDLPLHEYRNRLAFKGVKLSFDGSPQGKTAYLAQPYHVPPPGQDASYLGYPTYPQEEADARIARFVEEDIPLLVHANGDAAGQMLIDALDRAFAERDLSDHRTVMIHAQTAREDQLDAMKRLGVIPSFFSAHTFFWGDWHRDSVLGPERGSRISPTRTTHDREMPFTVHNDAPVVPADVIRLLWATTNRLTRSGQELGPEHRLDTLEAIEAVTINAAYQAFEEDRKGSITVGKQADLVVLDRNPLSVDRRDLLDVQVSATMSRGRWVYESHAGGS